MSKPIKKAPPPCEFITSHGGGAFYTPGSSGNRIPFLNKIVGILRLDLFYINLIAVKMRFHQCPCSGDILLRHSLHQILMVLDNLCVFHCSKCHTSYSVKVYRNCVHQSIYLRLLRNFKQQAVKLVIQVCKRFRIVVLQIKLL